MTNPDGTTRGTDTNPDPITGEPGAHPVGVGVGAAGGGATGAAIGTAVGGPVGTVVGAVVGAIAGGLTGKGFAEGLDPTAEDAYWRANHGTQPFAKDRTYDQFAPAYRTGYTGYASHGTAGTTFEAAEPKLRHEYESGKASVSNAAHTVADKTEVAWDEAKHAAKAAWHRVENSTSRATRP